MVNTRGGAKPATMPELHGKKVILCLWWNSRGVVHIEVLKPGQIVKTEVYSEQLTQVQDAFRRQEVVTLSINLLHDNARPRIAEVDQQESNKPGWTVLPHPPYSPDIAPSDYHIFRSMKHAAAGKKFADYDEIRVWVSNSSIRGHLISLNTGTLEKGC